MFKLIQGKLFEYTTKNIFSSFLIKTNLFINSTEQHIRFDYNRHHTSTTDRLYCIVSSHNDIYYIATNIRPWQSPLCCDISIYWTYCLDTNSLFLNFFLILKMNGAVLAQWLSVRLSTLKSHVRLCQKNVKNIVR